MANTNKAYTHWHYHTDNDNVIWLTIDTQGKNTNVLSRDVLEELHQVLVEITGLTPAGLIIRSDKKNGFIAGADISAFATIDSKETALQLVKQGQSVFTSIEQLPFPTLCLIHGFCLGGGLELALACDYRIGADVPETRIGLPEVLLGIHPGFGGTVRLIRLIGAPAALKIMLSGKALDAGKAARLGIITHAVPPRLLTTAAKQTLSAHRAPHSPGLLSRCADVPFIRPLIADFVTRKLRSKVKEKHYPAPYALVKLWKDHGGSVDKMMEAEARSIAALLVSPTAKNLTRVFFLQEQLKSLPADRSFQPHHVHVVGGGVMGGDIAAWCALQGYRVSIQDYNHDILARVVKRAASLYKRKLKKPHLVRAALDRLTPDRDGLQVGRADVIIEAIFENVDAKKSLYKQLEPQLKPDALLATNTSSIPLETLAVDLNQPDRLIGLHFFNPVAKMMLVEVVQSELTSQESLDKAIQFTKQIKKLPLPVKSSPGFLVNRILMPYLHEAALMESEGIPPEQIDRAAVDFGMPVGPIELIDMVGLDICLHVADFMTSAPELQMPPRLRQLVEQGHTGKKSGQGFYRYKDGKAVKTAKGKDTQPLTELTERLILRLLNESVACLRQSIVGSGDLLDAGMVFGTGFAPFRGGVIHYIQTKGGISLKNRLQALAEHHGSRFHPDEGWESCID